MTSPSKQDFASVSTWLVRPECGDRLLSGLEAEVWDDKNRPDLAALAVRSGEEDVFTSWYINRFLKVYHHYIGHRIHNDENEDEETGFVEYKESRILAFTNIVGTVLASLVPMSAMLGLYFVGSMTLRLAVVAIFTVLFSTTLAIFTRARRIEIFTATAA